MRIRRSPAALAAASLIPGPASAASAPAAPTPAAPTAASAAPAASGAGHLWRDMAAYYDFDHPVRGDPSRERDLGRSGTPIDLVNGGAAMRVHDGGGRGHVLRTEQIDPDAPGNDDWKAGVYSASGVPSLHAFNATRGATVAGWFKMTGTNPSPDSTTPDPADRYTAIGLSGLLSGDSDGHKVRALLEVIDVSGTLRVVALGRRVDGGDSRTFAASEDWRSVLPQGTWVHLAATFDYDTGRMKLYKNGERLPGFYTDQGDPWQVEGPPEPDATTASDPLGIKIGGSFPQDSGEANPCNCRMDDLMFLDRTITDHEARLLHRITER